MNRSRIATAAGATTALPATGAGRWPARIKKSLGMSPKKVAAKTKDAS